MGQERSIIHSRGKLIKITLLNRLWWLEMVSTFHIHDSANASQSMRNFICSSFDMQNDYLPISFKQSNHINDQRSQLVITIVLRIVQHVFKSSRISFQLQVRDLPLLGNDQSFFDGHQFRRCRTQSFELYRETNLPCPFITANNTTSYSIINRNP